MRAYPEAARQAQEARGIFLSDEEFDAMIRGEALEAPETLPTVEQMAGLPIVTTDAEYDALASGAEFVDPEGNIRRKP